MSFYSDKIAEIKQKEYEISCDKIALARTYCAMHGIDDSDYTYEDIKAMYNLMENRWVKGKEIQQYGKISSNFI